MLRDVNETYSGIATKPEDKFLSAKHWVLTASFCIHTELLIVMNNLYLCMKGTGTLGDTKFTTETKFTTVLENIEVTMREWARQLKYMGEAS